MNVTSNWVPSEFGSGSGHLAEDVLTSCTTCCHTKDGDSECREADSDPSGA